MKVFKYFLLLVFVLLLQQCNSSDGLVDPNTDVKFNYDYGNSVSRDFYGQILDRNGNPVSGANVSIGTSSVQTNTQGFFLLKNASVKEKFAHIKATKPGYVNASRVLVPSNANNRITIMMIPATTTTTIATGTTSTVSLPDGTKVKFDGSFKDANGANYVGTVNVAVFNLKPSDPYFNESMPGSLLASDSKGEPKILESFGMMHVQLTGSAGQELNLANGHKAEITMPVDPSQTSAAPASIPLWSFDEVSGIWKQDGVATKSGNVYVGNVSHFSWWNCDYPYALATLHVTVTNSSAQPIAGVNVQLKLPSQSYGLSNFTNANGLATGMVPANQNISIKVLDQCNTVLYSSTIGPFAVGSTNSIPISVSSSVQTTTISGTLKTCSGNNVTNGFVKLSTTNATNYFQNNVQVVSNGTFSFTTLVCNSSQQFTLNGFDYDNMQTSGNIAFTPTPPATNVGIITTCNTVPEFVNYTVDNLPTTYCIGTVTANIGSGSSPNQNGTSIYVTGSNLFAFNFNGGVTSGQVLTSGYTITLGSNGTTAGNTISVNGTTNAITTTFSNVGPVGGYIDFTFSGTYVNSTGTHTVSGVGHVLRDN